MRIATIIVIAISGLASVALAVVVAIATSSARAQDIFHIAPPIGGTPLIKRYNAKRLCFGPDDYTCPAQCKRDLSFIDTKWEFISLPATTLGIWFPPIPDYTVKITRVDQEVPMLPSKIGISDLFRIHRRVGSDTIDEVLHHERCHEILYRVTGSSKFHD